MENAKVMLSRPVTAYGEEVVAFELREPEGHEVRTVGSPIVFRDDGSYDFNMDRIAKYVVLLSTPKLTPSAVDKIAAGDWLPMAGALSPFFVPSTPKT